jgi:cytochrome P450
MCLLNVLLAGLDTVNAELSYFFYHLALHEQDRARIAHDPSIIPDAVEEMLRAFPIVRSGREVTTRYEIEGIHLQPGDLVFLPTMSAGRDESIYRDASSVRFDRGRVRHLSFGAGPHTCVGAYLARKELVVALEEWHRRIPDYELSDADEVTERNGHVCGLNSLPLRWST